MLPPFLFHLGIKPEGGGFETLGSLNVSATFRMPREVIGLKSTVVPGWWGARCFQRVDLQDPLSPKANGSEQLGVPIALKACMTRSLECGNDEVACDENSPHFRYPRRPVAPSNREFPLP